MTHQLRLRWRARSPLGNGSPRGGCAAIASAIALCAAGAPICAEAREDKPDEAKFVAFSAPGSSLWADADFMLAGGQEIAAGSAENPAYLDLMKVRTRKGGLSVVSSYSLRLAPTGDGKPRLGERSPREGWGPFGGQSIGSGEQGVRAGHGVVVRVQRGLEARHAFDWQDPALSFFVAADSDAVAWRLDKATGNEPQGFYYQSDRVKIGDLEAGLAVEAGPARLGLAYVEREIRSINPTGVGELSREESFVGVTLTLK